MLFGDRNGKQQSEEETEDKSQIHYNRRRRFIDTNNRRSRRYRELPETIPTGPHRRGYYRRYHVDGLRTW